ALTLDGRRPPAGLRVLLRPARVALGLAHVLSSIAPDRTPAFPRPNVPTGPRTPANRRSVGVPNYHGRRPRPTGDRGLLHPDGRRPRARAGAPSRAAPALRPRRVVRRRHDRRRPARPA